MLVRGGDYHDGDDAAILASRCRRMIEDTLRESGGNKQKAAQALGLRRQGLIKMKRFEIRG